MTGMVDRRLQKLGIELPEAAAPAANYVPWVITGNLVFVSGQITFWNGELKYLGKVGSDLSIEDGQAAARLCALNIIAQVKSACGGDLDKVVRCVKLGAFVNATPDFTDMPKVANGASDVLVEVFGDKGKHARFAVAAPSLPLGVSVEIDAVFEIA